MKDASFIEILIYLLAGMGLYHWVDFILGVIYQTPAM